jgi:hypothetical protein
VALALFLYGLGLAVALAGHAVYVTQEDGFYYYRIAQQVAAGAGSTFDGLHPTNGYHPLWLLCLVPIFWVTRRPESALMLGVLLQGLCLAAGSVVLYYTLRHAVGRPAASLAVLFWLRLTYFNALSGLEFSLHALGVLMTAWLTLRCFGPESSRRPGLYLALGLTLSLTFLARLDTLLLAGVLFLFLLWRERQAGWTRESLRRLLACGLPVVVTFLLYAGANLWWFGHVLPISSVIKRDWSATLLAQDPQYQAHGWLAAKALHLFWPLGEIKTAYPVLIGVFGAPGLFLVGASGWQAGLWRTLRPYSPFVCYSALQFLVTALVYHGDLSSKSWYYVIQPWLTVVLAGLLFDGLVQVGTRRLPAGSPMIWARRALLLILAALWCAVPLRTVRTLRQTLDGGRLAQSDAPLHDAAQWARANLPPDAVLGSWNAGTIGFLSGRRVVNLDGLVNSWDYYLVERHDLCRYWQKTGVTYLVDAFKNGQALSRVPTYAGYASCASGLKPIWSEDRYGASWRMEAYRLSLPNVRNALPGL